MRPRSRDRARPGSRLLACAVGLALLASVRAAGATPGFPAVVAATLGMANAPPCALCHDGGRTGLGTVQTPFGKSIRAHGASAGDEDSLRNALHDMDADGTSSLHDGTPDTTKLRRGLDPNGGDSSAFSAPPPAYGCGGAHLARTPDARGVTPIALSLAAWLLRRRRRRR